MKDKKSGHQWINQNSNELYTGRYIYNNLHNKGIYISNKRGDQTYYDGMFYMNKLEGYGTIVNAAQTAFEGLFKNHKRFGPGIVTYADNTQDVGLWDGFVLRRLITVAYQVPTLVTTSQGEAAILKFREMVPILDHTIQIKNENDIILDEIYHPGIRDTESLFFDTQLYNEKFFGVQQEFKMLGDSFDRDERMASRLLQLQRIDLKLEKLSKKARQIENQLSVCKSCCKHKQDEKLREATKSKQVSKQVLSFLSSCSQQEEEEGLNILTKSEVEIQNYLYSNSLLMKDFTENVITCKSSMMNISDSRETIPFSKYGSSVITNKTLESTVLLNGEDICELNDVAQSTLQIRHCCLCKRLLSNNFDNLQQLFTKLNQEETFYNMIKLILQKQIDSDELKFTTECPNINVSYLTAWNNEEIFKEMLQHSIKHRFCENLISFKVEQLLTGHRNDFNSCGQYEKLCYNFLQDCAKGADNVLNYFVDYNINSDLCDAKGNTGLMLAAANDKHGVVQKLINCGAKIDFMNDDCLTPLTFSFLRYISLKYNISNWEQAFVKVDVTFENTFQNHWPHTSFDTSMAEVTNSEEYFFDLEIRKTDKSQNVIDEQTSKSLNLIKKTILKLLTYGGDPNIGIVPLNSIFLCIFTDDADLMWPLLKNKANPNLIMSENNLTSLHIIGILKPSKGKVKMCQMLLSHGADPNIKTSPDHWSDLQREIIGKTNLVAENNGKNALHLLALRKDFDEGSIQFLSALVDTLVMNGCKTDDLYLGHSPLSLAIVKNNATIVEIFLQTRKIDPHLILGNNMGNALSVLCLNRYSSYWNLETKKNLAEIFFRNGLNPLHLIGMFENVVAFMENEEQNLEVEKSKSKQKGASKKSKRSSKKSTSRNSSKKKKQKVETFQEYIIATTRKYLIKHIQAKAVQYLYKLVSEALIADPLVVELAKFIPFEDIVNILHMLFKNGILKSEELDFNVIHELIHFIKIEQNINNKHCEKELKKNIGSKNWECRKYDKSNINLPPPELDESEDKYIVCFHCLLKNDKFLIRCPNCELIYFCSQRCNDLNDAIPNEHKCNISFYNSLLEIIKNKRQPSRLQILVQLAEKIKNEKRVFLELQILEEKMSRLHLPSAKTRKQFEILLEKYHDVQQEKEQFAIANNLWDERLLFITNSKRDKPKTRFYDLSLLTLTGARSSSKLKSVTSSQLYFDTLNVIKSGASTRLSSIGSRFSEEVHRTSPVGIGAKGGKRSNDLSSKQLQFFSKISNSQAMYSTQKLLQNMILEKTKALNKKNNTNFDVKYYMQLLSKVFADFNLPLLLLPYACYKDGQVYYSMAGQKTCSESGFHKLKINE